VKISDMMANVGEVEQGQWCWDVGVKMKGTTKKQTHVKRQEIGVKDF
jgi:hypothetical protein